MQRSIFVLCLRRVPFFRQALFHKERVSERKYPKNASRNPWFLHFLWRVQELLPNSCRNRELVCFYSRCRFIGRLKGLTPLYCLKIHLPNRTVIPRKPSKRRLWRMKRGGFEEVSRFSRHNVVGNRLTRR